jgi:predicted nucleic acid-binding protein
MNGRFFLDTNVFVYSLDRTAPKKALRATELIREALDTHKGVISFQVAQEFFNVAFRRFTRPMSVSEAEQYLGSVLRPLMAVQSSAGLYVEALQLKDRYRLSWYDSLIVAAAIQAECSLLYSEDLQHGQELRGLKVWNPFL